MAVCDREFIGKTLHEGELTIRAIEEFYKIHCYMRFALVTKHLEGT
ncbi:MAG: hypothetical protein LRZ87_01135 [Methanocellales archaeon]|nr:hypothetical protein [Methanocellales archaeon]